MGNSSMLSSLETPWSSILKTTKQSPEGSIGNGPAAYLSSAYPKTTSENRFGRHSKIDKKEIHKPNGLTSQVSSHHPAPSWGATHSLLP